MSITNYCFSLSEVSQDYEALSEMVDVPPCNRSACVEATIKDDTALEGTEQFFVTLDRGRGAGVSGRIRIDTNNNTITITVFEDEVDGMLYRFSRTSGCSGLLSLYIV